MRYGFDTFFSCAFFFHFAAHFMRFSSFDSGATGAFSL